MDGRKPEPYPTLKTALQADRRQICIWYETLSKPTTATEKKIFSCISKRYIEFGGTTAAIRKEISKSRPPPPKEADGDFLKESPNLAVAVTRRRDMARKLLTREEIERENAAIMVEYHDTDAAKPPDKDAIRRWRRIKKHPVGGALFNEAMRLAARIPNAQLATDIFEHIAEFYRPRIVRRPGKRAGPHDAAKDQLLLYGLDLAMKGKLLPGQSKPWSKPVFVQWVAKTGFGGASAIDRRLTRLINERKKRTK